MILSFDNLNFNILSFYHILLNLNHFLLLNFAYLMHYFFFHLFLFEGSLLLKQWGSKQRTYMKLLRPKY
jgi:hypothetical protein